MEWVILWAVSNGIIGWAIGQRRNNIGTAIAISIFFGPLGWLVAALDTSSLRKCPFCAERVKPEAAVCRYCGRDLPPIIHKPIARPTPPTTPPPPRLTPSISPKPAPPPEGLSRGAKIALTVGFLVVISIAILGVMKSTHENTNTQRPQEWGKTSANQQQTPADDFRDEQQTLYATITSEISAYPAYGRVNLHPGKVVLVTGRNSKLARINLSGYAATIPLSAIDLTEVSPTPNR